MSTGSLGQGLSVACGMALSAQISGCDWHTYAILGDGELQEGQVWEAFMAAGNLRLSNLTAIIDNNGVQLDGDVRANYGFRASWRETARFWMGHYTS